MSEGVNTALIVVIISGLWSFSMAAGWALYKNICRSQAEFRDEVREVLDHLARSHQECRLSLHKEYVMQNTFDDWKKGREKLWHNLKGHRHDSEGRVILPG